MARAIACLGDEIIYELMRKSSASFACPAWRFVKTLPDFCLRNLLIGRLIRRPTSSGIGKDGDRRCSRRRSGPSMLRRPSDTAMIISSVVDGALQRAASISRTRARSMAPRSPSLRCRRRKMSSARSMRRTPPRINGQGSRPPTAPGFSIASPTGSRIIWSCWRLPRRSTTASRSARRALPTFRSRSTISAISPAASGPRKAGSRRSMPTPSPIIFASRLASSARSSRGTSRC